MRSLEAFIPPRFLIGRVRAAIWFSSIILLLCLFCPRARGAVGVVLDESLDSSVERITGSGHNAVYLSRVCPGSPVKLRLCLHGEQGSVISTYTNLGEDQPYEWNVVPLSVYLYGVGDPLDRPLFGTPRIKRVLEENYRDKYLTDLCTLSCQTNDGAEWRSMVGVSLFRGIYIFVVDTTEEQDRKFIAEFNALPNVNHFNPVRRNCADFTRRIINTYFPHATKGDYLNDFGMTSPKAISRSFTRYALRHPESHFRVLHVAQVPGTIKRSSEVRDGTEQLYHSKKLLVPMLLFAEHTLPVMAASYMLTGRFNPQHEADDYPTAEITDTSHQIQVAKAQEEDKRAIQLEDLEREQRAVITGTGREWKLYRQAYESAVDETVQSGAIASRESLATLFQHLEETGTLFSDRSGSLWVAVSDSEKTARLGLSLSNVLAADSDPRLADELLLERVGRILKSPKHGRETMLEFREDWALLQDARAQSSVPVAHGGTPVGRQTAALSGNGNQ